MTKQSAVQQVPAGLPVFRPSAVAQWIVAESGEILSASGAGWSKIDQDPAKLVGESLWRWAGDRPDVRELVALALRGSTYSGTVEYGGHVWQIELTPVRHPSMDGVFGCACLAVALEPEQVNKEPEPEPVRLHGWREIRELEQDDARICAREYDRIVVEDGREYFTQVRHHPIEDLPRFLALRSRQLASTRPRLRLV